MVVGLVNDEDAYYVKKMKQNDRKSTNSPYNYYRCRPYETGYYSTYRFKGMRALKTCLADE